MGSNPKYDPDFTQKVIDASGPNVNPRIRQLVSSLIRHTHDFLRENEVTHEEWNTGLDFLNSISKTNPEKNMISQVLGIFGTNTLLDEIADKCGDGLNIDATPASALGPFFRDGAPTLENDSFIFTGVEDPPITYLHGIISDQITKKPIAGAWVDVWQASTNGLYENQDENQVDYNLRAKFKTDDNGNYSFYCLRPTSYVVAIDGPFREMLRIVDRPAIRPGHIHLKIECEGYKTLVTQIYDSKDSYLAKDFAFAVKDKLILEFKPSKDNAKARFELDFPIVLVPTKPKCS